jgi:hypothetical protein
MNAKARARRAVPPGRGELVIDRRRIAVEPMIAGSANPPPGGARPPVPALPRASPKLTVEAFTTSAL